jgi:hypothetical protein
MASLQAYQSHGIQYYRIVESFRNNGKPSIRVLAHLGRVDDILQRHQQQQKEVQVRVSSVSAGAVTAIHHLTLELVWPVELTESLPRMRRCKSATH